MAFRAFGGGLWDYNVEADKLSCNQRWYDILGVDSSRHPIRRIAEFKPFIYHEDVKAATRIDIAKLNGLIERDERYFIEFRVVRPTGELRWVRSVACLTGGPHPQPIRALGCITDITEFRHSGVGLAVAVQPTEEIDRDLDASADDHGATTAILSARERECLLWVSLGKTAWETAQIIERNPRTVEFHLANVVGKLGAANKVHAVAIAIRSHLL